MSTEPLDEIQWKLPEWIQQFGLNTVNVLDYFAELPFYDRTLSNQVLRMQFQFQQILPNIHPQQYIQLKLTEMVGVEFVVAFVREPDFWIIRKQRRLDPNTTFTEQDYYIIGANVYQAPKIHDILLSRLLLSVLLVRKLVELVNSMTKFSIADGGHIYPTEKDEEPAPRPLDTPQLLNPGTSLPQTSGLVPMVSNVSNVNSEVSAEAFDSLLGTVVSTAGKTTYLDDIPLYGKGSTVEQLGLKLNLYDD